MIDPGHELPPIRVEKLLWRGRGLARLDSGQVVIVEPGVLPGELIQARIVKIAKDFLQAEAVDILEQSPLRGAHPCPHGRECGGSPFGMVKPEQALELKRDIAKDSMLRALGRIHGANLPELGIMPSPKGWRYRWRGQIHVRNGHPHAMGRASNNTVPLSDCHLLAEPLAQALPALAATLPDGRFTVAASPDTGVARTEKDADLLPFSLPDFDLTLMLPAGVFFQANWELNQHLVRTAVHNLAGFERVADLFSGAGNFALPLATTGAEVLAVEGAPAAVSLGEEQRKRHRLTSVRFQAADLTKPRSWAFIRDFQPQAAILDPPRTGAKGIARLLLDMPDLRRLVWISCDVVNTVRDLKPMLDGGWTVSTIQLYDMFPGTWHMEVLFILDRA